jgi:hypothetical protein
MGLHGFYFIGAHSELRSPYRKTVREFMGLYNVIFLLRHMMWMTGIESRPSVGSWESPQTERIRGLNLVLKILINV